MDEDFTLQVGLKPLPSLFQGKALDGHVMGQVKNKISPVCMLPLRGHGEYIQFLFLPTT